MEVAAESAVAPVTPPLPADVLACIYLMLPDLGDFVHCICSSRAWAAAAKGAWQQKCRQRWTRGEWPSGDDPEEWWAYYKRRHQIDKEVEELLASASFRESQADSLGRIVQHLEVDAWDLVTAAAKDFSPSNLGRCYWARAALFHLAGRQVGARLQQLLEAREEVEPVAGDTARLLEGAEELTDLALQFVLLHHPLADVGALRRLLQQLAEETQRRMEGQGVDMGTVEGRKAALVLLNQVLFGPQPPAQTTPGPASAAAAAAAATSASSDPAAAAQQPGQPGAMPRHHQQAQEGQGAAGEPQSRFPLPGRVWGPGPWGYWMEAPDLSSVRVPAAPYGLGLKGERGDYYNPANSLLDHMLVDRQGLPIILSLVHVIVGRRVGLPLRLFTCPGHVVSLLVEPEHKVYIDAFEGGQLHEGVVPLGGGVTLSLQQIGVRMLRNVEHAYSSQGFHAAADTLWGMPALRVKSLRMHHEAQQGADVQELVEDLLELMAQAGEAELYALGADAMEEFLKLEPVWSPGPWWFDLRTPPAPLGLVGLRADHPGVRFRVGDVIRHRLYGYRGVITSWTPTCTASQQWQVAQGVARLPHGSQQPFYQVLVDLRDRPGPQTTYVAQDNIMVLSERPPLADGGSADSSGGTAATAAAAAAAPRAVPSSAAAPSGAASSEDADEAPVPAAVTPAAAAVTGLERPDSYQQAASTTTPSSCGAGAPPSCTSQHQPVHHPDVGKHMAAWVPGGYDPTTKQWGPGWYAPAAWLQRAFPQG